MLIKAIVTGHTRGLGEAVATTLLERGIAVLGLARRPHDDLGRTYPDLLQETVIDLADAGRLGAWLAESALRDWIGGADQLLLVNNAGMLQPIGPLDTQAPEAIASAVMLNVAAPLMLAGALASASRSTQDRRIVHISSGAARNAYAGWSIYCATKAALDRHAEAVALDGTPGLWICSLAPGVIDTDMQAQVRATPTSAFPMRARFETLKHSGALAAPADCAERLVTYLLSDAFGREPVADLRDLG